MNTTNKVLNDLKKTYGLGSDYALSKFLGCSHNRISNYRRGVSHLDDLMAYKVAELLELDPAELVAQINMERAKRPEERKAWKEILERLGSAAAGVAAVAVAATLPPVSSAVHYILC